MPPVLRAPRLAAVVLALLAADLYIALPATADIVPTSSSSASSTSPTPAPTPCPTDITGLVCQAAGGPTPTPTPKPSPTPTKSSSPSHSPSPTSTQPPTSGAAPGGSHRTSPPPPPPAPTASAKTIAEAAATFQNAPFLSELLDILRHPTASQRPDLRHFRPAADQHGSGAGGGLGGPFGGSGGGSLGAAIAVGLLGMLLAVVVGLLAASHKARLGLRRLAARAWSWHPSVRRVFVGLHNLAVRLRPLRHELRARLGLPRMALRRHDHRGLAAASAVAALPAMVVAAVLGSAATPRAPVPVGAVAGALLSPYLRGEVSVSNDILPAASQGPAAWVRLVHIERGLAAQQDELTAQERQIARLVVNLGGHNPDGEDSVAVGSDSTTQDRNRLAELVAAHDATQAAYQQSLQAEYDLYRTAAQDPAQRTLLTQAASAAPQAQAAVAYNLSLVQTQLSQETAIAGAEARLQALGSLTEEQLRAMRRHQAFLAPLAAPVTQAFGPTDFALEPPLNFNGVFYPHFHTGLDLGAPLDTPVHAAADGVVLLAAASVDGSGRLVGYGNYVVVAHPDGFVTLYGHLDSVAVKAGQVVHQGEIVGLEGSTGWSTGPHVHFEIRHDGQFLDPAPYLAGQLPQ
jgi:murein DD-endopeptidase MepM/ murein hydrolase activator NlpD